MGSVFYCKSCKSIQDYYGESDCLKCQKVNEESRDEGAKSTEFSCPQIMVKGAPLAINKPGVNMARGVRTSAQQERMYAKMMEKTKKQVQHKKREMRTSTKDEADTTLKARIPRELYIARTREFGKNYWQDEGETALKRDGLLLDD